MSLSFNKSWVAVANRALAIMGDLGDQTIISLDESNATARACKRTLPGAISEVLETHPWSFAITRQALSRLEDAPLYGFAYAYQLPTDPKCLRVLGAENSPLYRIVGDTLETDEETINIEFLALVTDPNKFPQKVLNVISLLVAANLVGELEGQPGRVGDLMRQYMQALLQAQELDANQDRNQVAATDTWIASRG